MCDSLFLNEQIVKILWIFLDLHFNKKLKFHDGVKSTFIKENGLVIKCTVKDCFTLLLEDIFMGISDKIIFMVLHYCSYLKVNYMLDIGKNQSFMESVLSWISTKKSGVSMNIEMEI